MKFGIKKHVFIPLLLAITLFGFLLRVQVCRELAVNDKQVASPSKFTDMYTYKLYSEQILKGEYKRDFYYQPFYYAVFLPLIKQCAGFGVWPVILVQCMLSAMTIWFASISSAMLWGRRSGVFTSLFLVFSTILILYTPYHLIATLQAFWISLIGYIVLKELKRMRKKQNIKILTSCMRWGFVGLVVSFAILTRGNIWFFLPGIMFAWFIVQFPGRNKGKNSFSIILKESLPLVLFLLMVIIPQIPFAVENTRIKGKISGPSTAAGAVLSLGNTPESPPGGRDAGTGPGPMEYPETCRAWTGNAEKISVPKRIWEWFYREPLAFCELQFRKMLLFWDYREIPNNIAIEHHGLKSPTLLLTGLIPVDSVMTPRGKMAFIHNNIIPSTIALLVFSLAGMFMLILQLLKISFRKVNANVAPLRVKVFLRNLYRYICGHSGQFLIFYFIIAYWLGTAAFYILARFRLPLYPLLAVFAGACLNQLFITLSQKKKILPILFFIAISFVFINFGYDFYRYKLEAGVMRVVRPNGVVSPLDDKLLIMDNGPFSFGSWQTVELKENVPIIKKFSLPEVAGDFQQAKLFIDLIWNVPGSAVLEINGKKYFFEEKKPVKKTYEFKIPLDKKMQITILPGKLDCRLFAICDFQRDYMRSTVNGKNQGGEFVCKLILSQ